MINRKKERRKNAVTYVVLSVAALLYSLPILNMVGTALKGDANALSDPGLFPKQPTLSAFWQVLQSDFMRSALNSLKIGLIVTLFCVLLSVLAGYALSRFRGRFFVVYQGGLLVLQMFPLMLMLIPLFIIFSSTGLQGSQWTLILSYTALNTPFSTYLMKGFFDTIPIEIEESAMIDGCSRFQSLVRIVLPMALTGIATVAIFTFLNAWNEYTFANIFVSDPSQISLTVGLQKYVSKNMSTWGQMMAASTISILPSMVFLLFAQKYIVKGLTAGSVKG